MRRASMLIALALVGCQTESSPDTTATPKEDACPPAELGWVQWVLSSAEAPAVLKGSEGAWISFYKRDYRAALKKFGSEDGAAASFATRRTHLRLAALALELAELHAHTFADYVEARGKLGTSASPLPQVKTWASLARKDLSKWKRAKPGACGGSVSKTRFGRLLRAYACSEPMACGTADAAFKSKDPLREREDILYAAACSADDPTEVMKLASEPAARDPIVKEIDGESVETELQYFDPLALVALAQFHLRQAKGSEDVLSLWAQKMGGETMTPAAVSNDTPQSWLFSSWRSAEELSEGLRSPTEKVSVDELRQRRERLQAVLPCNEDAPGIKTVEDLDLLRGLADASARRAAGSPYQEGSCGEALEILRATVDLSAPDKVGYVNEPTFLVRLAAAAMCRGRTSEAIGALRGVQRAFPEATGALAAAEALSVVRMMGGSHATQRTQ